MLSDGRAAALALHERVRSDRRFIPAAAPELDIVVWAPRCARASETAGIARRIFVQAARRHLYLALAELPADFLDPGAGPFERDRATVTCLRSVLMKPEHRGWVDRIWQLLDRATGAVLEVGSL